MQAYDKGSAAYFATPPTNLIWALQKSLTAITKGSPSLEERFALHKSASEYVKNEIEALGLKQVRFSPLCAESGWRMLPSYALQVTLSSEEAANGMSAVYFPEGVTAADVIPELGKQGIIVAGGLHKDIKGLYALCQSSCPVR